MTTFGSRIASLRKKKGLTQLELAKLLNISKSALGMYETDKREPNFETLMQIAEYFEVTLDYLIAGKSNY
ncbi:helix-turn-helix domain-containing protein [Paenibacillus harenae]|uniref:helix-turn-helix domain-containing protein n=1 Tax=Paenibacillus harenae TaxID=306543 RepID=UPI0003F75D42